MSDLTKVLFSDLGVEACNIHLHRMLTNKTLNIKNVSPDQIDIQIIKNSYESINKNEPQIYYDKNVSILWGQDRHIVESNYCCLSVEIRQDKIESIAFKYKNNLNTAWTVLKAWPDAKCSSLTDKNIKKLMQIFYKWSKIDLRQYKYNYRNKE